MRALVISGGGSKGAFGGGVAQYLIEELGHNYDLFIGTSTGSLLISHLALNKIDKIKEELKNKSIPDDKLEVVLSDFGIGAIADYLIELFSSVPQDDEGKPKD